MTWFPRWRIYRCVLHSFFLPHCLLPTLQVSELCLGTMTFGDSTDEATAHRILDTFVAAGGNFVDTADVYSAGLAETIVGRWLAKQDRASVVIATKVFFGGGKHPNGVGLSRSNIMACIDASLARLQTDFIDLYQIHAWDHVTDVDHWVSTHCHFHPTDTTQSFLIRLSRLRKDNTSLLSEYCCGLSSCLHSGTWSLPGRFGASAYRT